MSGPGFFNFFLTLVALAIIIGLIFTAMEFRPLPEPYKKFARFAIGGAAFLVFLYAIGSAFGWVQGTPLRVTPGGIIEFAIGVILLYGFLYLVDLAMTYFQFPFAEPLSFVLSLLALVAILWLAEVALTSGGLGIINLGGSNAGRPISLMPGAR